MERSLGFVFGVSCGSHRIQRVGPDYEIRD